MSISTCPQPSGRLLALWLFAKHQQVIRAVPAVPEASLSLRRCEDPLGRTNANGVAGAIATTTTAGSTNGRARNSHRPNPPGTRASPRRCRRRWRRRPMAGRSPGRGRSTAGKHRASSVQGRGKREKESDDGSYSYYSTSSTRSVKRGSGNWKKVKRATIAKATEGGASSSPRASPGIPGSPGILIPGRVKGEERCF